MSRIPTLVGKSWLPTENTQRVLDLDLKEAPSLMSKILVPNQTILRRRGGKIGELLFSAMQYSVFFYIISSLILIIYFKRRK